MKTSATALLLTIMLAAPAAAHSRGFNMLKETAVSHDLVKMKRQFEQLVRQDEPFPKELRDR
jgi:hypothetical protein